MPHARRRMPLPAKVHAFDAEVCGDQELRSCRNLQYRAIVANTPDDVAIPAFAHKAADAFDELSFWQQAA